LKTVLMWTLAALVIAAVLVISGNPPYWLGRLGVQVHADGGPSVSSYTPRIVLPGRSLPPAPRENPVEEKLDVSALQAASEYAEAQQSKSLIITRHGYIVFEKYWQGSTFDTVVDSRGLGRVLAALTTSGLGSSTSAYGTTRVLDMSLAAPPGTRWLDQNVDPDLLGQVIHRATGRSYADYVSEAIWARVGAGDASFWLDNQSGEPHVDTGFFARQSDWLRVAELLLNNGNYQGDEVISPRWVPELLKPASSNPNYGSYVRLGLHPAPGASPYATSDVLMVEGGGNRMWLVPSLQLAILRTGGQPGAEWDDGRIPNLVIRGARDFVPAAARPGADLRLLVPNH
jgi:hypothetical protein